MRVSLRHTLSRCCSELSKHQAGTATRQKATAVMCRGANLANEAIADSPASALADQTRQKAFQAIAKAPVYAESVVKPAGAMLTSRLP